MPGTVRQDSGKWTAYYANGCPVMDEEGIPIAWATEDDAWRVVGGRSAMPSNPTARERAERMQGCSYPAATLEAEFLDAERSAKEATLEHVAQKLHDAAIAAQQEEYPGLLEAGKIVAAIRARKETP